MKTAALFLAAGALLQGCVTHGYAENLKLASFDDGGTPGKPLGPVEGRDCVWRVLGYSLGGDLSLGKAFANARTQASTGIHTAFVADAAALSESTVRYLNNISTAYDGFDAYVVGKSCLVVKGAGFK